MFFSRFRKNKRKKYLTLDPKAYVLPINKMDEIIERSKHGKVVVTKDDIGDVQSSDALMHLWAYMNNIAVYNLRYGYITSDNWQDVGDAEKFLQSKNIYFE
jgi:hypothetical protein